MENENSSIINNLKIGYYEEPNSKNLFPNSFEVKFEKFGQNVHVRFARSLSFSPSSLPESVNVYVLDETSKQPKLFQFKENIRQVNFFCKLFYYSKFYYNNLLNKYLCF